MSNGQQIKVDGTVFVQGTPQGNLAPFVRDKALHARVVHDFNVYPFLAELYNGTTPFRRNWEGDEYFKFIEANFAKLDWSVISTYDSPKLRILSSLVNPVLRDRTSHTAAGAVGRFKRSRSNRSSSSM
jgi:hypothetical protein